MNIGYIRVSTDRQDLEAQRYGLSEFARSRGIEINKWVEDVVTGRKRVRDKQIGAEILQMRAGDCLLTPELSRLGRGMFDILNTLSYCLDNGIRVMTVKEKYVLGNDIQSKILAFAFSLAADLERQLISDRTKDALQMRRRNGQVYGHLPYGMTRQGNNVGDCQVEGAIIRQMIELRDSEMSYRAICDRLNEEGIFCRGKRWNVKKVYNVFQRYGAKKENAGEHQDQGTLGPAVG